MWLLSGILCQCPQNVTALSTYAMARGILNNKGDGVHTSRALPALIRGTLDCLRSSRIVQSSNHQLFYEPNRMPFQACTEHYWPSHIQLQRHKADKASDSILPPTYKADRWPRNGRASATLYRDEWACPPLIQTGEVSRWNHTNERPKPF